MQGRRWSGRMDGNQKKPHQWKFHVAELEEPRRRIPTHLPMPHSTQRNVGMRHSGEGGWRNHVIRAQGGGLHQLSWELATWSAGVIQGGSFHHDKCSFHQGQCAWRQHTVKTSSGPWV